MKNLPLVSFIIISYVPENKHYLDACIDSIQQLTYPKDKIEVIVVGKPSYLPEYPGVKTVSPPEAEFFCSRSVNYGVSQSSPESKYLMICNDDVIFTQASLLALVQMVGENMLVVNGISPCQQQLDHLLSYDFVVDGEQVSVGGGQYKYEAFAPKLSLFFRAKSNYPPGLYFLEHLCMFATLVPRKVWDLIGPFDENLKGGPDDIDFSWRCRDRGIRLGVVLNALIWHFGSVSIEKTVFPNPALQVWNWTYFKKKWGHYPPYVNEERVRLAEEAARKIDPSALHPLGNVLQPEGSSV